MRYPAYPAYKDSGVAWLGDVPLDWPIASVGYRYDVQLGKMLDEKRIHGGFLAPYLRNVDVQWDSINTAILPEMDFDEVDRQKYRLLPGDLLVCEGGEVGRCAIWEGTVEECYYQKALHRLRPRSIAADNPRFLFYLLSMAATQGRFTVGSNTSTIEHLPAEKLRRYRFPFPHHEEQAAIAAFLDCETAKIAALIAKQERMIALLREKRQALIAHAVTKGLRADAPMKDSGVAWLGEIPAHWEIVRNKVLFREFDARSTTGDEELLTVSHITGVTPRSEKNVNMIMAETLEGYKKCEIGDLVINTMWAWMGAVGLTGYDGLVSPSYNVYRPRDRAVVNRYYFDYLYRTPAHVVEMTRYSKGIWESRLRLYPDAFLSMLSPLPPADEQAAIATFLAAENTKFDALIAKAQQAIALMREHRTSLIAAAVTGKIDVRGEVMDVAAESGAEAEVGRLAGVAR